MRRKEIILEYRTSGKLKGLRPAIVSLKANGGKIYDGGQADFIMSLGKTALHFQRLSFFTHKLLPQKDFSLDLKRVKSYNLRTQNLVTNCLTLYTFEKYYIEIFFNTKTADTYESETNIAYLIKELKAKGVSEIK